MPPTLRRTLREGKAVCHFATEPSSALPRQAPRKWKFGSEVSENQPRALPWARCNSPNAIVLQEALSAPDASDICDHSGHRRNAIVIEIVCIAHEYLEQDLRHLLSRRSRHRKLDTAARSLVRIARSTSAWHRTGRSWGHVELIIRGARIRISDIDGLDSAMQADAPYRTLGCPETTAALMRFVRSLPVSAIERTDLAPLLRQR